MVSVEEDHRQAAERIEAIVQKCRRPHYYYPYPESLITAICQYVAGEGALAQIQQEWKQAGYIVQFSPWQFIVVSDPAAERLDELDLRVLDICIATDSIRGFLRIIAEQGPIEQAYRYLLSQGVDKQLALKELFLADNYMDQSEQITALGKLLLSLIPTYFGEIPTILAQAAGENVSPTFFKLLLAARPAGYLDLALALAQAAQKQAPTNYHLGECAALLVKHNYAHFREWARQVASLSNPNERARITALQALLECDEAANIDLAVEAFRTPSSYQRDKVELQRVGLEAAYRFDPVKYLPLMEEAAVSINEPLRRHAFNLLKEADFQQVGLMLQRCITSGEIEVASSALDTLLGYEWPERQDYLISLLSHRFKLIRETSAAELAKAGERAIEALAPSLAHKSADARLAAIYALQRIGGEQARALLMARLDVEKSLKIKQAILDVAGVAAALASSEATPASPAEALVAEAEAVFKRVKKPALPWFDAAQMSGLRWTDGEPVPQAVVGYLLYLQSRIKLMEPAERVQQALPLIDRSSSGDLALALFNGWIGQGAPSKQLWLLPLACALADERLLHPLRQSIDGWAAGTRSVIAGRAVTAMVSIEGNTALEEINDLAQHGKSFEVKWAAHKALEAAAERRGITLDDVYDQAVSRFGFDEHGLRVFDYGPRQFTLRLYFDQTIQITDNAGKRFMKLPNPGKGDDASKAKAAQAAWNVLKKRIPQVVKTQAERLEEALKSRRSWDIARWQALFLKHPMLRSLAITLIWGVVAAESSGYQCIFRPLEDGSLTDVKDNAVELPAEGQIRIVHPAELDEEARNAWLQHLTDYEVIPFFTQLNQPVVQVQPEERDALWWEKYQGYIVDGNTFRSLFLGTKWQLGPIKYDGDCDYHTIYKKPAANMLAVLEIAGLGARSKLEFKLAIKRLIFVRINTTGSISETLKEQDERIIKLGDVPPALFSPVAIDVQAIAAIGEYREDWEQQVG